MGRNVCVRDIGGGGFCALICAAPDSSWSAILEFMTVRVFGVLTDIQNECAQNRLRTYAVLYGVHVFFCRRSGRNSTDLDVCGHNFRGSHKAILRRASRRDNYILVTISCLIEDMCHMCPAQ